MSTFFLSYFILLVNYYSCLLLTLPSPLLFPCTRYTVLDTHLVHGIPVPYSRYKMFPCISGALLRIHIERQNHYYYSYLLNPIKLLSSVLKRHMKRIFWLPMTDQKMSAGKYCNRSNQTGHVAKLYQQSGTLLFCRKKI